jgi:hypothetical protein
MVYMLLQTSHLLNVIVHECDKFVLIWLDEIFCKVTDIFEYFCYLFMTRAVAVR